jgi:hypothetical protein
VTVRAANGLQNRESLFDDFGADAIARQDAEVQEHEGISLNGNLNLHAEFNYKQASRHARAEGRFAWRSLTPLLHKLL